MDKQSRPSPIKFENLATDLVRFFNGIDDDGNITFLKSMGDFIESRPQNPRQINVLEIFAVANKLVFHGILADFGSRDPGNPSGQMYLSTKFSEITAEYGDFEFLVGGPSKIFESFKDSILPVCVVDENGSEDIGTGFFAGNLSTFVTCRHVVEAKRKVRILTGDGEFANPTLIQVHSNPAVDLAIIVFPKGIFQDRKPFRFSDHHLGESVLSIGYPPIPGFDALTVLEHGEISANIKIAAGEIVAEGDSYLDQVEYALMNARVKGGSSGAPVINQSGHAIGIVASTSLNPTNTEQLEGMGYGIITPRSTFRKMLQGSDNNTPHTEDLKFRLNDDGSFCTKF